MKLYDLTLSGNCYKVRLLAALAGIPLEIVPVDFLGGEHKRPPLVRYLSDLRRVLYGPNVEQSDPLRVE